MSPTQKISDLSQQLTRAVSKPHTDALLDSLLYLKGAKTTQAHKFAEFVISLAHDQYVNMVDLKGFSSEVRGWCLSWFSAYMRGEINTYAEQIKDIQAAALVAQQWGK